LSERKIFRKIPVNKFVEYSINSIPLNMKKFNSIHDAFDWWVKNIYSSLSPEQKRGKAVQAMQDYVYGKSISEKRKRQILLDYGHFTIETIVTYEP
jgi:hypothetical protein